MFEAEKRRIAQAREDAMLRSLMGGASNAATTSTLATNQEPLTLDKLGRLMADFRQKLGPAPLLLSSKLFPSDKAFIVENADTKFTCAHPSFWLRFKYEMQRNCAPKPANFGNPLLLPIMGMQIVEIDLIGDESEARRAYLRGIWNQLIEAVKVALVDLPDWLRSVPKFTAHG